MNNEVASPIFCGWARSAGVPGFIFVLVGVWRFLLPYFYEGDPRF
jgi:hypothetical protein